MPVRQKKKSRRHGDYAEDRPGGKPVWFWAVLGGAGLIILAGMGVGGYFLMRPGKANSVEIGGTNTGYDEQPKSSKPSRRDRERDRDRKEETSSQERFRKEKEAFTKAVAHVEKLGAKLYYDKDGHLVGVGLADIPGVGDKDLEIIRGITTLTSIDVRGTGVTDKGLLHLQGLEELRSLSVARSRVTRQGAKEFQELMRSVNVIFNG